MISLVVLSAVLGGSPHMLLASAATKASHLLVRPCRCVDCSCESCEGDCSLGKPVKINPASVDPVRGYERRVQRTGSEMVRVCEGGQCRWEMRPTFREVWIAR